MRPKRRLRVAILAAQALLPTAVAAYVVDSTVPAAGGCPEPDRFSLSSPINRQWSTALPGPQALLTAAAPGKPAQLDEVEAVILAAFGVWTGVSGTTLNAATNPNALAPLARTSGQDVCTNDFGTNLDGRNTICFAQSSGAFATGVLAFTRTVTADAPGVSLGASGPAEFAGQILDADILFRGDGLATFATPAALGTGAGRNAYDLESLLAHELGHFFGFDHSGIWRAMMFPFAPPPGAFLGERPSAQSPDAPLAEDDRTGLRVLYPDANDTLHAGTISGRVLPANPFALALEPSPSAGQRVTGIFGAQVVALDADSGLVVAGAVGGWSCNASIPPARFDGSFQIERLPLGRRYKIYAEPLNGLASPASMINALAGTCRADLTSPCTAPPANSNFSVRVRPTPP